MDVAKHPIGIDYRVKYLSSLLSKSVEEVVMVGICGIGGVVAFLLMLDQKLQRNMMAYCIYKRNFFMRLLRLNFRVNNVHGGINLIRERLRSKKVLIVLDDVDHRSQLEALAGNRDWFGSGSRVIITTRDEHLLNLFKVDERNVALGLNSDEAMHLFSWHAFQNPVPLEEYVDVAKDIGAYAWGLPLALTVLGSSLFGLSIEEWRNTVEKLKRIPDDNIQEKLKISFDALPDDKVKAIFLDISCCLRGVDKDDAVTILDACDFFAEAGIQDLLDRCLLTIDINNRLVMHGLIQDMGREIVRQESPDEPGRRSRLFFEEDISNVLLGDKATEVVEVMMVNSPMFKDMQLSTKAFAKMANLRLLQIDNVHLKGKFEHLPNNLKWLRWKHCPLKYIRSNFHLETLVALDMSESKFEEFKASLKNGLSNIWGIYFSSKGSSGRVVFGMNENEMSIESIDRNNELQVIEQILKAEIAEPSKIKRVRQIKKRILDVETTLLRHNASLNEVIKSNTTRYSLRCLDDNCVWQFHASKISDSLLFQVNTYEKAHSCSVDFITSDHRNATSKVICDYILELMRDSR
ncbi:disease resistance protein RUN1-like [Capsicum chacoense]